MKRTAILLVSLAGIALAGCNRQEPIPSTAVDARVNGVSPGNMAIVDPLILDDQAKYYAKHEMAVPAPAAVAPPAVATPAATAPATTAPAAAPK